VRTDACDPEPMTKSPAKTRNVLKKEALLLAIMLVIGVLLLPFAVYAVGNAIFGAYGGGEFTDFYGHLLAGAFSGNTGLVFLLLSPYLVWQTLRATIRLFRRASSAHSG
jgi:hypothetical protein